MLRLLLTLKRCATSPAVCYLLLFFFTLPALAETRHALVVGNDSYQDLPPLMKARNDARAVDTALRTTGFTTNLVLDAGQTPFLEAFANFAQTINPGDVALFYYAGHGIEIDGQNYLLPTDAPEVNAGQELVLTSRAVPVASLLETLTRRGARASIFILDACRDNPFRGRTTRGIGGTRGLAPVSADGTFILYSAGTGQAALDRLSDTDDDPNSVFTRALVPLLTTPGLTIRDITNAVRSDVRRLARSVGYDQFPAYYDEMEGDLEFVAAAALEPTRPTAIDPCDAARRDWPAVSATKDRATAEAFISAYAMCPVQLALARAMLNDLDERASVQSPEIQPKTADPVAENAEPAAEEEPEPATASVTLPEDTQAQLARLGCYDGEVDGIWGPASRRAMQDFAFHGKVAIIDMEPDPDLLRILQAAAGRICPLTCSARFELVGSECVLKTCPTGLVLTSAGTCVQKSPAKAASKPKVARNCYQFEGKTLCD